MIESGQELRAWRELLGLTQSNAADEIGLSRQTYVSYEKDGAAVPRLTAQALCQVTDKYLSEKVLRTLIRAQYPSIGHIACWPARVIASGGWPSSVDRPEWIASVDPRLGDYLDMNAPSAHRDIMRVVLPDHRRALVPVIWFQRDAPDVEVVAFAIAWGLRD